MVVTNIMMGLGNQMFQYAAGRALSLHLQTPLKVCTNSYAGYNLREYELEKYFEIAPDIATEEDLSTFTFSHPVRRSWNKFFPNKRIKGLPYNERLGARTAYEIFYLYSPPHLRKVYEERQFYYDKNFFKATNPVFLKGYWMSYKYFQKYEDIIKNDFTIRENLITHLKPISNEMHNAESIAIHVRCTDRKIPENLKLYGEIAASYFSNGINYIQKQKGNDLHLYVFSDDEVMAKKYIPQHLPVTFVSNNITKNNIEDFYLIMQCKNVVMTNSTFSWWAAYLNKQKRKIVVVPKRWYNKSHFNYKDIYYPGWIKIDN